MIEQEIWTAA